MPVRADKGSSTQLYRTWWYVGQPSLILRPPTWPGNEAGSTLSTHCIICMLDPLALNPHLHPHTLTSTPTSSHPHTLTLSPPHLPPHTPHSHLHTLTPSQAGKGFLPYKLPKNSMVFTPPRRKTEVLKPVNFMGKAKVCDSTD